MIFPWQKDQWQLLLRAKQENRLSHALLFTGIAGTGKTHFAETFIRAQFCKAHAFSDTEMPACDCHPCRLILGCAHPNVLWIKPEKEGGAIKIDQIRDVSDFANQTSLQGEYRITLINPAHNMNANAANALLKTLEEPPSAALFILISDQASYLPATILSRCQRITFPCPPTKLALDWLKTQWSHAALDPELILNLAYGAPLTAMQLVNHEVFSVRHDLLQTLYLLQQKKADPIKSATVMQDLDLKQLLDFILTWTIDLLRLQTGCDISKITNKDFANQLAEVNNRVQLVAIIQYLNYLQYLRKQIYKGINLNKQLMFESILIHWMRCT